MIRFFKIFFYAVISAIIFCFMIFLHSYNLFVVFSAMIIVPAALEILFITGCKKTNVWISCKKTSIKRNESIDIKINVKNRFSIGFVKIDFNIKSIYYDEYSDCKIIPFFFFAKKYSLPVKFTNLGRYSVTIKKVTASDLFDIFRKNISVSENINIDVMPDRIKNINIASGNTELDLKWALNNYSADNGDISGVREYIPGDRLNSIHWKAAAKNNDIMVKEYEKNGSQEYIVLFDFNKKYLDNGLNSLYSILCEIVEYGRNAYVMWLFSGCEDLSVKYINNTDDIYKLIKLLYCSYPLYDENITLNTFKRQFGTSKAIFVGETKELI